MNLKEFILYLGENPYKFLAAKIDADTVMEEAGLAEEDREILKSGDMRRIGEALGKIPSPSPSGVPVTQ